MGRAAANACACMHACSPVQVNGCVADGNHGACTCLAGTHGCSVAISGRRQEVLDSAVSHLRQAGIQAIGLQGDVRKKEDCERWVAKVVDQLGHLDVLVNCAAGMRPADRAALRRSVQASCLHRTSRYMGSGTPVCNFALAPLHHFLSFLELQQVKRAAVLSAPAPVCCSVCV